MSSCDRSKMPLCKACDAEPRVRELCGKLCSIVMSGWASVATGAASAKVEEIERDFHVVATLQSSSRYVTVSGIGRVVADPALIEKYWSEAWRVWCPQGKSDPALRLIVVTPERGEYWNNAGISGWRFVASAIKAYATKTTPVVQADQHAKVQLAASAKIAG